MLFAAVIDGHLLGEGDRLLRISGASDCGGWYCVGVGVIVFKAKRNTGLPDAEDAKVTQRTQKKTKREPKWWLKF
jgi:predicted Rdx family selenoprotein